MTTFKNQGIVIHEDISDVGISLTKDISLESLQAAVGGYIEPIVQHRFPNVTVFANEEGLLKNLPPNTAATIIFEYPLVGNVVMVADADEMAKDLEEKAEVQQSPKREGRNMIMFLTPRKTPLLKKETNATEPKKALRTIN